MFCCRGVWFVGSCTYMGMIQWLLLPRRRKSNKADVMWYLPETDKENREGISGVDQEGWQSTLQERNKQRRISSKWPPPPPPPPPAHFAEQRWSPIYPSRFSHPFPYSPVSLP